MPDTHETPSQTMNRLIREAPHKSDARSLARDGIARWAAARKNGDSK